MVGIELVADRATRAPYAPAARIGQRVVRAARARGVILRPLGNVIVLMPPLAIAAAELELLLDVARDAIREATGGMSGLPRHRHRHRRRQDVRRLRAGARAARRADVASR